MALDTAIVLIVCGVAVWLNPNTEATLHRFTAAWRLWRDGYTWHTAWALAAGR